MQKPLRVLLTNNTLAARAGSEVYIRDLAIALMKRGHLPVAYSSVLGDIAEDLRQATIPVISSLDDLHIPPDIIHGQHHLETMSAMLHFNETPAIFICHGWAPWPEIPPAFPRVRRYVAVDDLCREKILTTPGIRTGQVEVLYNFVDLSRFRQRRDLPVTPQKAMIFSNYVSEGSNELNILRTACARMGILQVDVVGSRSGNVVEQPESILPQYDLVFAKARCALEALACGCAVVITGDEGLGGLITPGNMNRLRALNFGVRAMQAKPLTIDNVVHELERYNAEDSRAVSDWLRESADLETTVDRWIEIYSGTITDWQKEEYAGRHEESRAAARYLSFLSEKVRNANCVLRMSKSAEQALIRQKKLSTDLEKKCNLLHSELETAKRVNRTAGEELSRQKALHDDLLKKINATTAQLLAIKRSRTWRLSEPYRKMRSWLRRVI